MGTLARLYSTALFSSTASLSSFWLVPPRIQLLYNDQLARYLFNNCQPAATPKPHSPQQVNNECDILTHVI